MEWFLSRACVNIAKVHWVRVPASAQQACNPTSAHMVYGTTVEPALCLEECKATKPFGFPETSTCHRHRGEHFWQRCTLENHIEVRGVAVKEPPIEILDSPKMADDRLALKPSSHPGELPHSNLEAPKRLVKNTVRLKGSIIWASLVGQGNTPQNWT